MGDTRRDLDWYRAAYAGGARVAEIVADTVARVDAYDDPALLIGGIGGRAMARAAVLDARADQDELPLFGVPVLVKDNIDVAGLPTTAGCPAYAYMPERSARSVELLEAAGAVVLGKTNLDQFATGLVGTRTPYGTPRNPTAPDRVPGGSSSGSGAAVAAGLVPLALGTDTAGSGRVPAAMCGVVGLKPTRGLWSAVGVTPACRSLDCVSVFTTTVADAWSTFAVLDRYDPDDPWARRDRAQRPVIRPDRLRVGIPPVGALSGTDPGLLGAFRAHVDELVRAGAEVIEVSLAPFLETGELLYGGPWVAERYASIGAFADEHPDDVLPVTREIIITAAEWTAADAHRAEEQRRRLARQASTTWNVVDVLAVPTVPWAPTPADVAADPVRASHRLGRFTTFANLLDLAALTVPRLHDHPGPPGSTTLYGPAGSDARLLIVGATLLDEIPTATAGDDAIDLAVVGAHLEGETLHHELLATGATFVEETTTAPTYRLWRLTGDGPSRPGLERVALGGQPIDVEVWQVPSQGLGAFVAGLPPPLGIGTVVLASGRAVRGFVCEPIGLAGGTDISRWRGWRAASRS